MNSNLELIETSRNEATKNVQHLQERNKILADENSYYR